MTINHEELKTFESGLLEGDIRNSQIRYCTLNGGNGNLHKTRPCIILQGDEYNKDPKNRIFVVPLSTQETNIYSCSHKLALKMNYENKDSKLSYVCLDRSIFIDRKDIGAMLGIVPRDLMISICEALFARIIIQN